MIDTTEQPHLAVKLFIRADPELGCEKQKQAVLERLDRLDEEGYIGTYDIHIWSKEIRVSGPLEGTDYYQRVFDHFTAFQQWATETSVRLNTAFKIRSLDCEITGETYTVLTLPSLCLAIYEDDELRAVYPHADGQRVRRITDCLDSLETDTPIESAN